MPDGGFDIAKKDCSRGCSGRIAVKVVDRRHVVLRHNGCPVPTARTQPEDLDRAGPRREPRRRRAMADQPTQFRIVDLVHRPATVADDEKRGRVLSRIGQERWFGPAGDIGLQRLKPVSHPVPHQPRQGPIHCRRIASPVQTEALEDVVGPQRRGGGRQDLKDQSRGSVGAPPLGSSRRLHPPMDGMRRATVGQFPAHQPPASVFLRRFVGRGRSTSGSGWAGAATSTSASVSSAPALASPGLRPRPIWRAKFDRDWA